MAAGLQSRNQDSASARGGTRSRHHRSQQAWQEAKKKNDFPSFRPRLEKVVDLKRQEADAVGYQDHRYNALIEEFEPGATVAELKNALRRPDEGTRSR